MTAAAEFSALRLCVLTVSDTRTRENDTSGDYLEQALTGAGHQLHERTIAVGLRQLREGGAAAQQAARKQLPRADRSATAG